MLYRISDKMALRGIKVIEMAGLAPAPMCGMILADFGASVIHVDKLNGNPDLDCLRNGKKSLAVNLKRKEGVGVLKKLISKSDVLIEPFRKGVMESLGVGPDEALSINPKLVYARLTGFGQNGSFSSMAGHDINYVAMSGVLSYLGRANQKPMFPVNLLADFAGGGMTCALGILLALLERTSSEKGQVVDSAMVEGTAYLASWIFRSQNSFIWGNPRGKNILDSGAHFYDTYETKDGKFMSVGAIEPQFYELLIEKLNLSDGKPAQYGDFEANKELLTKVFLSKTQEEWCKIFDGTDACVAPILSPEEASRHPHNVARNVFSIDPKTSNFVPNPAPKLSRTPGVTVALQPAFESGTHSEEILLSLGYSNDEIGKLVESNVVGIVRPSSKI